MKLEVLISTYNKGLENVSKILKYQHENIKYLINHQIGNFQDNDTLKKDLLRDDVKVFSSYTQGLSNNRNEVIRKASEEICLLADDDIELISGVEKKILKAFKDNPKADIITFKMYTSSPANSKTYAKTSFKYNFRNLAKVSSIEIAFRLSSIKKYQLYFDNRFGLGAKYPMGEEYIFLTEAYKKGLNIYYCPETIVFHPEVSTGLKQKDELIFAKGAVFARVFGIRALLVNIYFALRKRKLYKRKYSFYRYLQLLNLGSIDYLKGGK